MDPIFKRLWTDPNYFIKCMVAVVGVIGTVIPQLPLGDLGVVGYWIGKFTPVIVSIMAATSMRAGSGLNLDEASKLRALIPTQENLDNNSPRV